MKIEDVKIGVPFYTVFALGENSFIKKYVPLSAPQDTHLTENYHSTFVKVRVGDNNARESEISLRDRGIIPNTYNEHQSFLSEKAATQYLKMVKKLPYTAPDIPYLYLQSYY